MTPRSTLRWIFAIAFALIALAIVTSVMKQRSAQARPSSTEIPCSGSIQACIDGALDGDTIVIAAGEYAESLTLSKPVSLTGVSSTTTIIRAVSGQRVLTVTGEAISNSVVISGLAFTGGSALTTTVPDGLGGGILVTDSAEALIQNVIISSNQAYLGGGLYSDHALALTNTLFLTNMAVGGGGGAYIFGQATLSGGRFERNYADVGGGLYAINLMLSGTAFISNTTFDVGGAVFFGPSAIIENGRFIGNYGAGGGGALFGDYVTVTGTEFISNTGGFQGGGAIHSGIGIVRITGSRLERNSCFNDKGGGVYSDGWLILSDTQLISNTARTGGGAYVSGRLTSVGSRFQGNATFFGMGGGLFVSGYFDITGTQFIRNSALGRGGGLAQDLLFDTDSRVVNSLFSGNATGASGAALFIFSDAKVNVIHTTIADTSFNAKQGIVVHAGDVYFTNTIITSHTIGISNTQGMVFEDYNLFFGNTLDKAASVTSGGHSLTGNPAFVDTANDNYHLGSASAAINKGINAGVSIDVDGDSRPQGGGFDIGYDEWVSALFYRAYLPVVVKN